VESAHIFKNENEKFDTVVGLSANITSRLSSGKSSVSDHRTNPTFRREVNDLLQETLERIHGKINPTIKNEIIKVFERYTDEDSDDFSRSSAYLNLRNLSEEPGGFKVFVVGGVLHNNGVALSEDTFRDLQKYHELRVRPWQDSQEFIIKDEELEEEIVFRPVGDASLKGIEKTVPVWSAQPEKGA